MRRLFTLVLTILLLVQSVAPAAAAEVLNEAEPAGAELQEQGLQEQELQEQEPLEQEHQEGTEAQENADAEDDSSADAETEEPASIDGENRVDDAQDEQNNETEEPISAEEETAVQDSEEPAQESVEFVIEEEQMLYNGLEPDYDDPQFVKLLEEGFFQDENAPVRALAGSIHHDSRFKGYEITKGVDVSKWNGDINWSKAKKDGIDFAIIRCGNRTSSDGALKTDPEFDKNMRGAKSAGMDVGVYIFSQAITENEAIQEANFALKMCRNYDFDLPIVFDYEYYPSGRLAKAKLSDSKHTSICKAFCKTIENAGYQAMVYANKGMLENDMYGQQLPEAGYEVWLAYWTSNPSAYKGTYTYWQYSDAGKVGGFAHACDVNYRYRLPDASIQHLTNLNAGIRLVWNGVSPAKGYRVFRKVVGEKRWTKLADLKGSNVLTYIDQSAELGKKYAYAVQAYDGLVEANLDQNGTVIVREQKLALDQTALFANGIKVRWTKDETAEGYRILRRLRNADHWTAIAELDADQTSYLDESKLASGTEYFYTIAGIYQGKEVINDDYGFATTWLEAPVLNPTKTVNQGIQIQWKAVGGATTYRVYRRERNGNWSAIGNTKELSFTDTKAASGIVYEYTVRASNGSLYSSYDGAGVAGYFLGTPVLKKALGQDDGQSVVLSWDAVKGAQKYRVYRRGSTKESWVTIGWTETTSYSDTDVKLDGSYIYTVRAFNVFNKTNVYSYYQTGIQASWLISPKLKRVQPVQTGVRIDWNPVKEAEGYAVYRKSEDSGWKRIATLKKVVTYTDTKPLSGVNIYTVRAIKGNKMSGYDKAGISTMFLSTPTGLQASRTAKGVRITWRSVSGAENYRVYRRDANSKTWTTLGWSASGSYVDTTVKNNQSYFYTVRAVAKYHEKNCYSWFLSGVSFHSLAQPQLKSAVKGSKGITVSWKSVSGAKGYAVYRRNVGGSWKRLATVSGSSYLDNKAAKGTKYEYTVRAKDGSSYSWYDGKGVSAKG